VIFGIFIQSCKVSVALAAAISFVTGLAEVLGGASRNILVTVYSQMGLAIGLNFLLVLPATLISLELVGARMLLGPEPHEAEIESARTGTERFCRDDLGTWEWWTFWGWLLALAFVMATGIMLHIVWPLRSMFD